MTRIDPGVVSLVAELRGHERQAAEELGQWKTGVEEPKVIDASPAAITLALLLTDESAMPTTLRGHETFASLPCFRGTRRRWGPSC